MNPGSCVDEPAAGQDHFQAQNIVSGDSVFYSAHSARVGRYIAADGGNAHTGGIRRVKKTKAPGLLLKVAGNYTGLNQGCKIISIQGQNLVHIQTRKNNSALVRHTG